jgi:hypothetical protein
MEKGRSSRCRVYAEVAAFRREFIALMGGTAANERCRYSITSPARASNFSGILGPTILPDLRLINCSNFISRSTGMSADLESWRAVSFSARRTGLFQPQADEHQSPVLLRLLHRRYSWQ